MTEKFAEEAKEKEIIKKNIEKQRNLKEWESWREK